MSETGGKVWPCEHILVNDYKTSYPNHSWRFKSKLGIEVPVTDEVFFCCECGAKRPEEEKDELGEILRKHNINFTQPYMDSISKALQAWKEKAVTEAIYNERAETSKLWTQERDKLTTTDLEKKVGDIVYRGKEEKPKRLWEILEEAFHVKRGIQDSYQYQAKATLDWFEGILPPKRDRIEDTATMEQCRGGFNMCLEEIRQRLERERNA